jgi:dihydroorotase/N-acyl-D-amino-acid deacylase
MLAGGSRIRVRTLSLIAASLAAIGAIQSPATAPHVYDLLIRNGRIVDGTGAPWYRADVAIRGDRIAAMGTLGAVDAAVVVDATGMVVAPGFIDLLGQSEFNLLVDNRAASKVFQGVTTEITGEGGSIAPLSDRMAATARSRYDHYGLTLDFRTLAEYFTRLESSTHPAINLGSLVGAGGVRDYVIGRENRAATAEEISRMEGLVEAAMRDGALGLSSSLQYVPDRFASTEELVALARVAARMGGVYFTHQRSESGNIDESLDEVFTIAERAGIPAEIWHLKTAYRANWGRMPAVLARIAAARARGLDVTADIYPYTRASNGLDACLPLWVREGGIDAMLARLQDPAQRARIKDEMNDPQSPGWENQWYGAGGSDGIMVAAVLNPELRQYEGLTLTEIGRRMAKDPRDALMDLVIADRGETDCIMAIMDEADVRAALADPLVAIGTDSAARAEDGPLAGSASHPRGWGSFPRILGKYVRAEHVLTLEDAVRRFTSRPASRLGLLDRGLLRPGFIADITIFDPATIQDNSTFEDPNHYSTGVRHLFVNGRHVLSDGRITDERPGRVIRGPAYRPESPTASTEH